MPTGLVKFANRTTSGDKQLNWGRVVNGQDDYPYRGPVQSLREEEYETRTVRVADFRNNFFRVGDTKENQQFCEVMECVANGWFHLIHLERFWTDPQGHRTLYHYVEWVEYYLEDGSRVQAGTSPLEAVNAQG